MPLGHLDHASRSALSRRRPPPSPVRSRRHAAAPAGGQSRHPGTVNTPSASSAVPGYHDATGNHVLRPAQPVGGGQCLTACATATGDPACEAQRGAMTSANTPREAISAYDPGSSRRPTRRRRQPATILEDIATYYSGCTRLRLPRPPGKTAGLPPLQRHHPHPGAT